MTITKPKSITVNADHFVSSAPDSDSLGRAKSIELKTKRGINRSQVSIVLVDSLLHKIDHAAQQRYMSRSALITMALMQFLQSDR